ncbi:hypothetical protein ACGFNQ_35965 [Streptomyces asoensis]|uniref:hypothetical protein n=1 Tax=Streptomyces asoensis TaxID=249586 RepID=UPI00371471CE
MSEAKRKPKPEALAYGQALKKIFLRLDTSQREVAKLLSIDPSVLSRFFSAMPSRDSAADTVAAREHAEALIDLVRNSGAVVTDAEIAKLHKLRRAAQAASTSQQDRVLLLQEHLDDLQKQLDDAEARAGTFRGQAQSLEGANGRLEDRVSRLKQQVREEEQRAGREHWARVKEQQQREQADARAARAGSRAAEAVRRATEAAALLEAAEEAREEAEERARRAEWGADEAAARLGEVVRARAEAQTGADRARQEAEDAAACLASAHRQLSAAAEYAKESDARIAGQQEQLRQLRGEIKTLRHQVRMLTGEVRRPASTPIAQAATQVRVVSAGSEAVDNDVLDRPGRRPGDTGQAWEQRTGRESPGSGGTGVPPGRVVHPPNPTPEELLKDLRRPASSEHRQGPAQPPGGGRAQARQARQRNQPPPLVDPKVFREVGRHLPTRGPLGRHAEVTNTPPPSKGKPEAPRRHQPPPQTTGGGIKEERRTAPAVKPPLDLLAELTNTPPPPKKGRRNGKWVSLSWGAAISLLGTQSFAFTGILISVVLHGWNLLGFALWICSALFFSTLISISLRIPGRQGKYLILATLTATIALGFYDIDVITLTPVSDAAHEFGEWLTERA